MLSYEDDIKYLISFFDFMEEDEAARIALLNAVLKKIWHN